MVYYKLMRTYERQPQKWIFFVHFRGDFDANKCFEKIEFNFYFINMYLD